MRQSHRGLGKQWRVCLTDLRATRQPLGSWGPSQQEAKDRGFYLKHICGYCSCLMEWTTVKSTQGLQSNCLNRNFASLDCKGQRYYKTKGGCQTPQVLRAIESRSKTQLCCEHCLPTFLEKKKSRTKNPEDGAWATEIIPESWFLIEGLATFTRPGFHKGSDWRLLFTFHFPYFDWSIWNYYPRSAPPSHVGRAGGRCSAL